MHLCLQYKNFNASVVWQMHSGKHVRIAGNWNMYMSILLFLCIFCVVQQPITDLGRLIVEVLVSHTGSVGHLWTRDRPVEETATRQHTTSTGDRHPCPWRDSNPQPHQTIGYRPRGHQNRLLHRVRLFTCAVGHTNSNWIISLAHV